ncbi:MAG TPA: helix-turn-helix domain-containing protein [Solirubrobacterales bacterium]|nr:helix-turn-helix domain-containing protein [Solirubrobacterales bacterium]
MPPTASELISAVSHPLRRRILFAYLDGSVEGASASELAKAMDQKVGQVAYHLKTLAKDGILQPVQGGSGQSGGQAHYGWALGVEPEWLRLVLEVWTDLDVSR